MFREKFKYFKKKGQKPDFSNVLDVRTENPELLTQISMKSLTNYNLQEASQLGLNDPISWIVYELKSHPGFIIIRNPFTNVGQRYWIARSIADYSQEPSVTNLANQKHLQTLMNNTTWWEAVKKECTYNSNKDNLERKLRWATMGYHHDWDTKVYSELKQGPFPTDLAQLAKFVIKSILYIDFRPEACIVNYYLMDSFLSGHVDKSELNEAAPLISFSFGQTAIFLLGGCTIDEIPDAMFLESGDIVIMSGTSRFQYHGVPKIVHGHYEPWKVVSADDAEAVNPPKSQFEPISSYDFPQKITVEKVMDSYTWEPFEKYVNDARINLNVRQVFLNQTNNELNLS